MIPREPALRLHSSTRMHQDGDGNVAYQYFSNRLNSHWGYSTVLGWADWRFASPAPPAPPGRWKMLHPVSPDCWQSLPGPHTATGNPTSDCSLGRALQNIGVQPQTELQGACRTEPSVNVGRPVCIVADLHHHHSSLSRNAKGNKWALICQHCKCFQALHPKWFPSVEYSEPNMPLARVTLVYWLWSREKICASVCAWRSLCACTSRSEHIHTQTAWQQELCPSHCVLMVTPCSMLLCRTQGGCTLHLSHSWWASLQAAVRGI